MSRLLHWSPSRLYDRADSLSLEVGDGQAVVQVLIAEPGRGWSGDLVGELVLYNVKSKRSGHQDDVYLSFFASERNRFLIKMSDGATFWKARNGFVVIRHGQLLGLNFCVEHAHKADQLVKHMHGPVRLILSSRFLRVIQAAVHNLHPRRTYNNKQDQVKSEDELDPVRQPRAFLERVISAESDDI